MGREPVRMLIIEDDQDYQVVLRKEVDRLGTQVHLETCFLESVEDARRAVEGADVDVILSDFDLPDGTGADIMAHAKRASPRSRRVMLTGAPDRARAATAERGTPHAVWDKSIGLSELRQRLVQLVTGRVPLPSP